MILYITVAVGRGHGGPGSIGLYMISLKAFVCLFVCFLFLIKPNDCTIYTVYRGKLQEFGAQELVNVGCSHINTGSKKYKYAHLYYAESLKMSFSLQSPRPPNFLLKGSQEA